MSDLRTASVFIDASDSLVRSAESKRIPSASVVERIAALQQAARRYIAERRRS